MSAQRARSSIPPEHRSAHPNIPGVPWWGAVLIAVLFTAVGFAFDAGAGNKELTNVFGALYAIGCVAAVLAVRQQGVFTAVVQPPLILFIAVPGAYFLFHHSEIRGLKDILINCGYPLIERFLLMFTTSVIVLMIGMARWYFGAASRSKAARPTKAAAAGAVVGVGLFAGLRSKLSSLTGLGGDSDTDEPEPRKHAIDRPATAENPPRGQRSAKRPAPTRSRHARPPVNDPDPLDAPPPRRRRPTHASDLDELVANLDSEPPPRRRPKAPRDPNRRATPPPAEPRRREQLDPYERPRGPDRYDRYAPTDPYDAPPPPPRRRPAAGGNNGTHHPVSRVRYRGSETTDGGHDNDVRHRSRPRERHGMDDWRYQG